MRITEYGNLEKPDGEDNVDIEVLNRNTDKIAALFQQTDKKIAEAANQSTLLGVDSLVKKIDQKVGTEADSKTGTLFGRIAAVYQHLTGYFTAARAAKLDYLDANVASRQSEASALSRYNSLVAKLATDNGGTIAKWLRDIYTHAAAANTAAGNASSYANTAASRTFYAGQSSGYWAKLSYDNAVLGANRAQDAYNCIARGAVKSVQRGVYTNTGGDSTVRNRENNIPYVDITISTVNTKKALVFANESQQLVSNTANRISNIRLVNATTIRIYSVSINANIFNYVSWQVVEFY